MRSSQRFQTQTIDMYEQFVLLYGDCMCACCKVFKIWWQVLDVIMEMVILLKHSTPLLCITIILIRKLWVVNNSGSSSIFTTHLRETMEISVHWMYSSCLSFNIYHLSLTWTWPHPLITSPWNEKLTGSQIWIYVSNFYIHTLKNTLILLHL